MTQHCDSTNTQRRRFSPFLSLSLTPAPSFSPSFSTAAVLLNETANIARHDRHRSILGWCVIQNAHTNTHTHPKREPSKKFRDVTNTNATRASARASTHETERKPPVALSLPLSRSSCLALATVSPPEVCSAVQWRPRQSLLGDETSAQKKPPSRARKTSHFRAFSHHDHDTLGTIERNEPRTSAFWASFGKRTLG